MRGHVIRSGLCFRFAPACRSRRPTLPAPFKGDSTGRVVLAKRTKWKEFFSWNAGDFRRFCSDGGGCLQGWDAGKLRGCVQQAAVRIV